MEVRIRDSRFGGQKVQSFLNGKPFGLGTEYDDRTEYDDITGFVSFCWYENLVVVEEASSDSILDIMKFFDFVAGRAKLYPQLLPMARGVIWETQKEDWSWDVDPLVWKAIATHSLWSEVPLHMKTYLAMGLELPIAAIDIMQTLMKGDFAVQVTQDLPVES